MYNQRITLVMETMTDVSGNGARELTETSREVWANKASIGMREFYEASANGYRPEIVFEIRDIRDYHGEQNVVYKGRKYSIIRTYAKGKKLQLFCQSGVNNVSTQISY